ncbi:unnamed protein product, partial [Candidula unifasciata]
NELVISLTQNFKTFSGITLIEFAQIEPPNKEMHPMRVLIKIQKSDPPGFDKPSKWSKNFRDFVQKCLVKSPEQRPTAQELLQHPFIKGYEDKKGILDLICEAKAEVVEIVEDLTEEEDILAIKRNMSSDSHSIDLDSISLASDEKEKSEELEERVKVPQPQPLKEEPKKEAIEQPQQHIEEPSPSETKITAPAEAPVVAEVEARSVDADKTTISLDEGIGASGDEKSSSDSSETSLVASPAKTSEQQGTEATSELTDEATAAVDVLCGEEVAAEIVSNIIDDVLKSTSVEPSVASVVFDTFKDYVAPEEAEEELSESLPYDIEADIESVLDTNKIEETVEEKYAVPEEPSQPEKAESPSEDSGLVSEVDTAVVTDAVVVTDTGVVTDTVVMTENVAATDDLVVTDTVTVTDAIAADVDEDTPRILSADKDLTPATQERNDNETTVEIIETPEIEDISEKDNKQEPTQVIPHSLTSPAAVPQTDLDTFETRMSDEVSNLDDDSDKKSDSGSVNTVDSVGESHEQDNSADAGPVQKRQKKGNLRERNESKSHYRTIAKTRTYMKDGQVITSTTTKVIATGEENRVREEHLHRKQDLRELKLLQKQENKQITDLQYKNHVALEAKERKFETDSA